MNELNRFRRAREHAGLSVTQASRLSGIDALTLVSFEESTVPNDENIAKLADLYGVNVDWLMARTPLRDYESMRDVPGWDNLSFHDRDVVAEFAASLPRAKAKRP